MVVNDSWFSPYYHQLSPTIIPMVKRRNTLFCDSLQWYLCCGNQSKKCPEGRTRPHTCIFLSDVISGCYPISRSTFCDYLFFVASLLGRYILFSLLSWSSINIFFVMVVVFNINMKFWSCSWASWGIYGAQFKQARWFWGKQLTAKLSWSIIR